MANELGESGKSKIYIVTYDNPRPSNGTNGDFIDYYGYFISWTIKHKLNQLASFEGEAYGISDATKRSHFNANNYIYVMSGSDLVSKFVIEKPIYDTRGSTKVTAIQSSGANLLTAPFIKNLARTATAKKKFKNSDAIDVFTDTDGILIDGNGDLVINPTIDPSLTDYISISLNKHNRINAVNRACNLFKAEWTITHGENVGPNPFSEGDFITIQSRLGLDSSAYTFYLSGTNTNATLASGTEQIDTATNHVILKGTDINGKQIQTELFDASGNSTTLNLDLDAWLDGDIDPSETTINIKPGHNFVGLTNFYVKIDNEVIKISSITGNVMTVSERGSDGPLSDNTIPTSHKDG